MAKPKSSARAKRSPKDKIRSISVSVKKQFKIVTKPNAVCKSLKEADKSQAKKRGTRKVVNDDAEKNPIQKRKLRVRTNNKIPDQKAEEPIKKFFSAKEKTYDIPKSPDESSDIYDFLSLTNKGERKKSDPILKKILAHKDVDLKSYKNGRFITRKKRQCKPSKPLDSVPKPSQDVIPDATTNNFSFNNVVNSTPANSAKTVNPLSAIESSFDLIMHSFGEALESSVATTSTNTASSVPGSLRTTSPSILGSSNTTSLSIPGSLKVVPNQNPSESAFKSPPLKNDLRRNAILNSNRQHTAAERRQLLEQVTKIIPRISSTPLMRKTPLPHTPKALSPIAPLVNSTMWVQDQENYDLPRVSYFGRSSDLTPSYSSDAIPQTPQKPSSKSVINTSNEENIPLQDESFHSELPVNITKPKKRVPLQEIVILRNDTLPNWNNKSTSSLDYDNMDNIIRKRNSEMVSFFCWKKQIP